MPLRLLISNLSFVIFNNYVNNTFFFTILGEEALNEYLKTKVVTVEY